MTYSGVVKVGGPADVHELTDLMISKVAVGPMNNNAYLLRCRATGEQLLIDAAAEAGVLLRLIGEDGIASVVTTHRHGDHWQALAEDGGTIRVGQVTLTARHLTGHTPGSVALVYDDPHGAPHLFTGDCLFPGGVGNTHKDPEAFASLLHDVETKLFDRLPDETWVYPGHGHDTTLGAERPQLPRWRERGW